MGSEQAQRAAKAMMPHKWWAALGESMPALRKFALAVTSQVTTASACERNWSAYEHVVSKKRNRL